MSPFSPSTFQHCASYVAGTQEMFTEWEILAVIESIMVLDSCHLSVGNPWHSLPSFLQHGAIIRPVACHRQMAGPPEQSPGLNWTVQTALSFSRHMGLKDTPVPHCIWDSPQEIMKKGNFIHQE